MRAVPHVIKTPRKNGNMRQLEKLTTTQTASNAITIEHHIPVQELQTMRKHYKTILAAIDTAIASEKLRIVKQAENAESSRIAKEKFIRETIQLARIMRKRQLSTNQAKAITSTNHTLTRDKAAHGRKQAKQRKKAAIYKLYLSGKTQRRICAMLGYSAPYVSKIIKVQKENASPELF